ncbi:caspase-1-like isoform X1 [Strigops habroptila]|nr:caspase-1-like isoform X1 [Strigops habroptila]XP_030330653.1 caspase-1-like isoform X1 [Strigops habroptila]XP_030330654.1 caspase-1-like isoform X1 [Strigops habroptila]XP_030330655.1 caspase-1-like isoform X1 [Strigops habroptila]
MTDKLLLNVRLDFVERASKPLISGLLDELMARGVLNQEEVEEVQDKYTVRTDKARCLIDCVRLKGPRASQIFIDSLRKRDGTLAEQLGLATDMGLPGAQLVSPSPLVAIQGQQWIRQCSLSEYQHIRATEGDQIYPLYLPREVRTRRALLICNIDFEHLSRRNGAEVDVQGMTKLLEGLGYAVDIHHNLSSEEMATVMNDFADRKEHCTSDSTFLVFMSHGVRAGLCGTKSRDEATDILSLDTIYEKFNNQHCQALLGKPKVVIIQSCRGGKVGSVLVSEAADLSVPTPGPTHTTHVALEGDAICEVHLESDFATLHSSTPDTVSWRSSVTGSLFIQHLIEQFRNHAYNSDLEELFRKVQYSFGKFPRQLPSKERTTMPRKFFLFPGI